VGGRDRQDEPRRYDRLENGLSFADGTPLSQEFFWIGPAVVSVWLAGFDAYKRRIPNEATYGLLIAGLVVAFAFGRGNGALVACSICFLPSLAGFYMGVIGGGDVKLLAGLGSWLGPQEAMWLLLLCVCFASVISIMLLVIYHLRTALSPSAVVARPKSLAFGIPVCCAFWAVNAGLVL